MTNIQSMIAAGAGYYFLEIDIYPVGLIYPTFVERVLLSCRKTHRRSGGSDT